MLKINVKKIFTDAKLPIMKTEGSSGYDLYSYETINIKPSEICLVSTGLSMEIPIGYEAQVRPRSGLAIKKGITVLNTPGTIDADYRGEIKVILINLGKDEVILNKNERIAQLVFQKIENVIFTLTDKLSDSSRAKNGFGSSGLK